MSGVVGADLKVCSYTGYRRGRRRRRGTVSKAQGIAKTEVDAVPERDGLGGPGPE